jgi:hypothetical protein
MISMGAWNYFHRSIDCYGPTDDFYGYMEVFPWVHGNVSVGHSLVNKKLLDSAFGSFLGVVARV